MLSSRNATTEKRLPPPQPPQPAQSGGMSDTVAAERRLELVAILSDPERFDLVGADNAWGGELDVVSEVTGQLTEWVVERDSAD